MRLNADQREHVTWWVRDMVESSGRSKREVAAALAYQPKTIRRWCSGQRVPAMRDAEILCKFLGLNWAAERDRMFGGLRV